MLAPSGWTSPNARLTHGRRDGFSHIAVAHIERASAFVKPPTILPHAPHSMKVQPVTQSVSHNGLRFPQQQRGTWPDRLVNWLINHMFSLTSRYNGLGCLAVLEKIVWLNFAARSRADSADQVKGRGLPTRLHPRHGGCGCVGQLSHVA